MIAAQLRRRAAPELNRPLDMLDRSHQSLSELIDGVLLTEKLEAGKIDGHPVELRLGQIMESALEAARGVAVQKGLAFECSYDPDRPVQVDPLLTRSAIQNLADNAAKFADRGHIEVLVEDDGDELIVHFRDTCQGLSPEELRTIFEPFERGATRKAGTGLGLAIARRAVEAQGGSIGAESPGPSGCHFWLRIPAAGRPKTEEH
jgi:signal transduction histidine kinase